MSNSLAEIGSGTVHPLFHAETYFTQPQSLIHMMLNLRMIALFQRSGMQLGPMMSLLVEIFMKLDQMQFNVTTGKSQVVTIWSPAEKSFRGRVCQE